MLHLYITVPYLMCYSQLQNLIVTSKPLWYIIIIIIDDSAVLDITDLDEIQESIKEIVDWKDLGLKLGLLYPTLQKIETDVRTVNKCKREMLAAWLKGEDKSKDRTWSTLVDGVHKMNHHSLAEEITEQHLKWVSEFSILYKVMNMWSVATEVSMQFYFLQFWCVFSAIYNIYKY